MDPVESAAYWDWRYRNGIHSGHVDKTPEQLDAECRARANHINMFVASHGVRSVLDIGSGDGLQAQHLKVPDYLGLESSHRAIELAEQRTNLAFELIRPTQVYVKPRELHISLDVIQHQVTPRLYRNHMRTLFSAARYAVVASPDTEPQEDHAPHVLYHPWGRDVPPDWMELESRDDLRFWRRRD